jgi:hypothetical protein
MFNLLKKQTMKTNYPESVTQIHKEFEESGAELLKQAEALLDTLSPVNSDKAKRLQSLGFKNVPEVKQVVEAEQKIVSTKAVADLVKYYQRHYPFNKFITDTGVTKICSKYDLVCGDIGLFKGFVPETKLKDIESFKLRESDKGIFIGNHFLEDGVVVRNPHSQQYFHIIKRGTKFSYTTYAFQSNDGIRFYANDIHNVFGLLGVDIGSKTQLEDNATHFSICAPMKDMDMTGMEVKNYRVVKHIPDPVVLKRVNGGYLIVCAWGDEASDEIVVNSINN